MASYNERQKKLLLKAYKIDAERTLNYMKAALNTGNTKTAAALGLYYLVPTLKRGLKTKAELQEIRRKKRELRKAAKINRYAGGYLHTS